MKHKIASKIFVLSALLALIFSAVGVAPAQAWGPFSHNELVRMAYALLPANELKTLLHDYQGSVLAGSVFPDWAMATALIVDTDEAKKYYNDLSEFAHWPQFIAAYLKHVKQNYTYPYDIQESKSIAFMFGLIAHNSGDPFFHDFLLPYIQANEIQIFGTPGHTDVEFGVDVFNVYHGSPCGVLPYGCAYKYLFDVDWYLPTDAIMAAYAEIYTNGVTWYELTDMNLLTDGWATYQTASTAQIVAAGRLEAVTYYSGRLYNTYWNSWYYNLHPGGMTDAASHIADGWQQTWQWMNTYSFATTINLSPAQPDGNNEWYKQPVTITLTPKDNLEGTASWLQTSFKTYYSLDGGSNYQEYSGPFMVSTDGVYQISYYSVDSIGISEPAQNVTIKIDMTSPTISGITTTLPNNNGWYNTDVIVHFTAEDLVSGLDTLSPDQTLTNEGAGQSVIGTAVDLAGNSAEITVGSINIDKTSPVVNVWVDKPSYTKTEKFIIHFSGSDALSGLNSLTAQFNGQSVVNGQTIDLFWLPLGTHTLTVRAEDLAGNVTEVSQSIELSVTLDSLKGTVARLCAEGYITKSGTCNDLSAKLDAALAAHNRGNDKAAVNMLSAFQNAVNAQMGKSIQERAARLLLLDGAYVSEVLSRQRITRTLIANQQALS